MCVTFISTAFLLENVNNTFIDSKTQLGIYKSVLYTPLPISIALK